MLLLLGVYRASAVRRGAESGQIPSSYIGGSLLLIRTMFFVLYDNILSSRLKTNKIKNKSFESHGCWWGKGGRPALDLDQPSADESLSCFSSALDRRSIDWLDY